MQEHDPAAVGDQGWALLEQAFEEGDPAGFVSAAKLFREALASGPTHPDEPFWHHGLGLALGATADRTGEVADWDAALGEFRQVWEHPDPDIERDVLAGGLAYALVQRFTAVGDEGRAAVDGLVADLDALQDPDGPAVPVVDVLRGRARLERFGVLAEQADHDEGVALLAAALPDVPDNMPLLVESWFHLAVFTADAETPGIALDAVGQARRLMGPDDRFPDLDQLEADLLYSRWVSSDDPGLLDETLERLEWLCTAAATPPSDSLASCGVLRLLRGEETGSIGDLDAAVRWMEQAEPDAEDEEAVILARQLGTALLRRARLTGHDGDRYRALAYLAAVLSHDPPFPELHLDARRQRLEGLLVDVVTERPTDPAMAAARSELVEGLATLDAHPDADADARAGLAFTLAHTELAVAEPMYEPVRTDHITWLLDVAADHPTPPDGWSSAVGVLRSMLQHYDDLFGGPFGPAEGDFGRSSMVEALRKMPRPEIVGPQQLRRLLGAQALADGLRRGDIGNLTAAAPLLRAHPGALGAVLAALAEGYGVVTSGHATDDQLLAAVDRVVAIADATLTNSPEDRFVHEFMLPPFLALRAVGAPSGGELPALPVRTVGYDMLTGDMAAMIDITRSLAELSATSDTDRQRQLIDDLTRRAHASPVGTFQRISVVWSLLAVWLDRAGRTGDPHDAGQAISWSGEALDLLDGAEHPLSVQVTMNAAKAHRLRGTADDRDRSRELGREVLRGHAWRVLLQSGTEHAITMARNASADAVRVARWCLQDRDSEGLVAALDAGRGLVLHAAVTTRGVVEQLRAAGETELAQEWADAGGADRIALAGAPDVDLHGDLRRRVLKALGAGRSPLLNPPSIERIREALVTGDADALIYLLPADGAEPGLAVIVPVREPVEVIELPHLDAGAAAERADQALPGASRDIESVDASARLGQPADLTDWAWRVAGYELGDTAERLRRADGELPRLLLVPFGALARVPWHAAGLLPELAVVSAVPSARLLYEAVSRPAMADGAQLVVGNPTGDLQGAGVEARAVTAAFYPSATYLGEDGSAAAVLERLGTGAPPLSLLHLACHGHADPNAPGRSHLRLADRAVGIDEVLALRPTAPLDVGIVCLAACSTNVPGADYDEAFSLAAAFLAAGARTVFASMWPVPDDHTSRLMFMVHHYLAAEGCSPAEALHRARRWALDPQRVAPDSMPAALLAGMNGAEDAVAWAGFQHLGA